MSVLFIDVDDVRRRPVRILNDFLSFTNDNGQDLRNCQPLCMPTGRRTYLLDPFNQRHLLLFDQYLDSNAHFIAPGIAFLDTNFGGPSIFEQSVVFRSEHFCRGLPAGQRFPFAPILGEERLGRLSETVTDTLKSKHTSTMRKLSSSTALKNCRRMKWMRAIRSLYGCSRGNCFSSASILLNSSSVETYQRVSIHGGDLTGVMITLKNRPSAFAFTACR